MNGLHLFHGRQRLLAMSDTEYKLQIGLQLKSVTAWILQLLLLGVWSGIATTVTVLLLWLVLDPGLDGWQWLGCGLLWALMGALMLLMGRNEHLGLPNAFLLQATRAECGLLPRHHTI
jgi:hypothetical protein